MKTLFLMLMLVASCLASTIDGFREYKWGCYVTDLGATTIVAEQPTTFTFFARKEREKKSIGTAEVLEISYGFYNQSLFLVRATFRGESNYKAIIEVVENKYGKLERSPTGNELVIHDNVGFLSISYNEITQRGYMLITNTEMFLHRQAYEKTVNNTSEKDL